MNVSSPFGVKYTGTYNIGSIGNTSGKEAREEEYAIDELEKRTRLPSFIEEPAKKKIACCDQRVHEFGVK